MPFTGHYTFTLLQINVYLSNVIQCIHRAVRPAAPNQTKQHEKIPACSNLRNGPDLLLQYTGDSGQRRKERTAHRGQPGVEPPTDLRSRTAQQRDHEGNGVCG